MKFFSFLRFVLLAILISGSASINAQVKKPRVLVFTKTLGYRHASIPAAREAMMKLGKENGFDVDTTTDVSKIEESNLKQYAALIFISISGITGPGGYGTGGYLFDQYQRADLQRYIQAGGGFVGIHEAVDAMYDFRWYGRMIGGYFGFHPAAQPSTYNVIDKNHPSTSMLPDQWKKTDETYYVRLMNKDIHVLVTIDESTVVNRRPPADFYKMGNIHPIAWYHEFEGGRSFYTALGHTDSSYSKDVLYQQHVLGGIKYAIGKNAPLNYSKVKQLRAPAEDRFTKNMLVSGTFNEPTEMTILPNLDILVAQRKGEIIKYDQAKKTTKQVGSLNVATDGIMGIQADPDFKTNHYVYIYYGSDNKPVNYLSRFTFINDKIDGKSEKIILEVKADRGVCCNSGGSIAFGKDRTLFLSTGDNTASTNNLFAPLNGTNDARTTAGNTNDLRGKVLRIKIKTDGTYEIPAGNLFPKGTANTRSEIYVMGNRNPYRITVDKKNGFLYWGEMGAGAIRDSLAAFGPRGYDEINQARKAGNFGWPLFAGPNLSYRAYDNNNGKPDSAFNPLHPENISKNNTGLKELPPAQPAFLWYPNDRSAEFWQLGTGERMAMAGPVYHGDLYAKPGLPAYYNDKLFIYDQKRNWIKAIGITAAGDYDSMEPFMENTTFKAPVDMEIGPDGKLYILEAGALSRIDFK